MEKQTISHVLTHYGWSSPNINEVVEKMSFFMEAIRDNFPVDELPDMVIIETVVEKFIEYGKMWLDIMHQYVDKMIPNEDYSNVSECFKNFVKVGIEEVPFLEMCSPVNWIGMFLDYIFNNLLAFIN